MIMYLQPLTCYTPVSSALYCFNLAASVETQSHIDYNPSQLLLPSAHAGDVNHIIVGSNTNIQDNAVVHVAKHSINGKPAPTIIGNNVTVGASVERLCAALLMHACTLLLTCDGQARFNLHSSRGLHGYSSSPGQQQVIGQDRLE